MKQSLIFVPLSALCPTSFAQAFKTSFAFNSIAPSSPYLEPITVGDRVPADLTIENIINFSSSKIRFADLQGKLLLIDFWGTTCASCIGALPKIDSLQKKYKGKIQVLTVTNYDNPEAVKKTFERYKKLHNSNLPVVLNDVKLKQLFPHELLSHVIWLDPKGVVKAITGTEYITAVNIEMLLGDKPINWPIKKDLLDFDYSKPLVNSTNNLPYADALYYSVLTSHMEGIDATSRQTIDSVKHTITFNNFNFQLNQLCNGALGNGYGGLINPKELILLVKDRSRYIFNESKEFYAEWAKGNTYCYSLQLPLTLSVKEQNEFIKLDLQKWLYSLGISVRTEVRKLKCLVLALNNSDTTLTKQNSNLTPIYKDNEFEPTSDFTLRTLIGQLNEYSPELPWVINETGLADSVKLKISIKASSFKNLFDLQKEFERNGLSLVKAERERKVFVVEEKGIADTK